jgi:iron complex outermembrane receptor protein
VEISASRLGDGIAGTSSTVIDADDIARDPADTLADIVARQAGVQVQSLYGGVNGTGSTVSLRGFGATGSENTLILVNGRRVNDPDQSVVDLSAIPLDSIERIEITRGNSGAVLYGDGAVGGVINIVTKTGINSPASTSLDLAYGSDQSRQIAASTSQSYGDNSVSLYASNIDSNGYRDNNDLRDKTFVVDVRHAINQGSLYLNLRGEDQDLGLPGGLTVTPGSSPLTQDPRAASTPTDFGDQQSLNLTLGGSRTLIAGIDLTVDGGIRQKEQQFAYAEFGGSYNTVKLTTASLTPRVDIVYDLFALPVSAIVGVDLYESFYDSYASAAQGDTANDHHILQQRTEAVYGQQTVKLRPDTDLAIGVRLQRADIAARERVDAAAPGGAFLGLPGIPLNTVDNEYAAHLGLEHRLADGFAVFGRLAHSMRMPNIDDRNFVAAYPTNFALKTQTSFDAEIGARASLGRVDGQISTYTMQLRNEIDFDPGANGGLGANVNFDPTRRTGVEAESGVTLTETLRLKGTVAYTDAVYRSGPYKGNEVPQVAAWTGNLGLSWDIWQKWAQLDVDARAVGLRRLGDDQTNTQPEEPAYALIDLKVSGIYQSLHWSLAVRNLADAHYFDQGFAGGSPGTYSIFPMPGRTLMGRMGVTF